MMVNKIEGMARTDKEFFLDLVSSFQRSCEPGLGYARPVDRSVCQKYIRASQEFITLVNGAGHWGGRWKPT